MEIRDSIEQLVGKTPLVRLSRFASNLHHNLLAKCEFLNPGGSVKDRIAFHMVKRAEDSRQLRPGGTIVEATAGNTGIGLALAAALGGYKLVAVMTQKVSQDKVRLLTALGAEVVIVPPGKPLTDPDHFINRARSIAEERGGWLSDQFNNESNVEAHYKTTGPEIWAQTEGNIDVLIAGVGTGGTLTGAGRYLKERKSSIRIVLADPIGSRLADLVGGSSDDAAPYLVEGIGQDFVPQNLDVKLVDDVVRVSDQQSVECAQQLLRTEAMFVGSSSGCIAAAALRYAKGLEGRDKNIVLILPDGGRGYMSTIYDVEWLSEKLPNLKTVGC